MNRENFDKKGGIVGGGLFIGMVLLLLLCLVGTSAAQIQWDKASLTRGKAWLTIMNSCQFGNPVNPPSQYYLLDYPGYSTGANLWDHMAYLWGGGYMIYAERDGAAEAYTINSAFYASSKYVYPTTASGITNNYNFVNPILPAEEIATGAHHVIDLDVDVAHKTMVWSYPMYDDFVIHEYTVTNTGETSLNNLYFGVRRSTWMTEKGDGVVWGNASFGWGNDSKYGWDETRQLFYIYDDWTFIWDSEVPVQYLYGPGPVTGDIGDPGDLYDPGSRYHELYAPGYLTTICLDPAGTDIYQNIGRHLGQDLPLPGVMRAEDLLPRMGTHSPTEFLQKMTLQQPRMSWDEAKADPSVGDGTKWERAPEMGVNCGPYAELAPGASVTFVFAEVLGEMDRAKIVEGGSDNVTLLATESLAALLENVDACVDLYNNGNQIADHPPMTPTDGENSLTLTPVGGGVKIAWPSIPDTYVDPVDGVNDFSGYRVYRSSYFCTGPWNLVVDIPIADVVLEDGMVVYNETNLPLGVGNYYTVTSYDMYGNESGKVNANRYPVYPMRAPNADFPKAVYVVPNPFRQHSGLLGTGESLRMEFIGLPSICTIRIYTIVGELVREIEHNDGSGSEAWGSILELDYQVNRWMMYVAPGVYVYHVESKVAGHEGEYYIGKFAIIK